jgi:hypothetical protein
MTPPKHKKDAVLMTASWKWTSLLNLVLLPGFSGHASQIRGATTGGNDHTGNYRNKDLVRASG